MRFWERVVSAFCPVEKGKKNLEISVGSVLSGNRKLDWNRDNNGFLEAFCCFSATCFSKNLP